MIDGCTPLEEDEETIYGLIDQDYDWIINNSELHDSIIKIDENNIEMMLFENILSSKLINYINESCEKSRDKSPTFKNS